MDLDKLSSIVEGKVWREDENFRIETIGADLLQEVLQLLKDNFYSDETLAKSQRTPENAKTMAEDFETMTTTILKGFPGLGVFEKSSNKLVAANIITIFNRSGPTQDSNALLDMLKHEEMKRTVRFLIYLDEKSDLFNRYGVDTILEYYIVSVDRNFRKKGLACQVMQCGLDFAKALGIRLVYGCYSSLYTRRAAQKIGKEVVTEIDLNTYKVDGEVVFKNTEPHNVTSIMAILLPQ